MVERINFGKLNPVIDAPDLIEIQTKSYTDFLQIDEKSYPSNMSSLGCSVIIPFSNAFLNIYSSAALPSSPNSTV